MKTTIEISDPLLDQAREIAARDGETLRSLVEQGLRAVIAERSAKAKPFRLRDFSVKGDGLHPAVAHLSMHEIILMSYGDRGG
ncbi:MAG: type II toxin-antitoxin system VapB family antitoxin [Caldimonas sp.]